MIILSNIEFNYLLQNSKMYKYLRYYNKFSRNDEPIMIIEDINKKRVGSVKTLLTCILQGKLKESSLIRYVEDTPYKIVDKWIEEIERLYGKTNVLTNGYIFLLELNKVEISVINNHPSCIKCLNVNFCSDYKTLLDINFCENRITRIELNEPLAMIKKLRKNLFELYEELDKMRDTKERNDLIIEINGLMADIRSYINV